MKEKHSNLRHGAEKARLLGENALLGSGENSGDSIGFRQQRAVDHGEGQSRDGAHHEAGRHGRRRDDDKCHRVAKSYSHQDDVRQLASCRFHHRCCIVPEIRSFYNVFVTNRQF